MRQPGFNILVAISGYSQCIDMIPKAPFTHDSDWQILAGTFSHKHLFSVYYLLIGLLGPYKEIRSSIFLYGPILREPCTKVRALHFQVWTELSNPVSKEFITSLLSASYVSVNKTENCLSNINLV